MERNRYDRVLYRKLLSEMILNGDTYESLANICDIDAQTFGKKMRGTAPFTVFQVDILCRHYGKPYEYLFSTTK